jgi:flagellar basal body-associated protein FliL
MNSNGDGKPEPVDPEPLLRMLDLELMQKRAQRQQAAARRGSLRAVSFLFLFIVILAAVLAAYFVFSSGRVDEIRARNNPPSSPAAAPATRP